MSANNDLPGATHKDLLRKEVMLAELLSHSIKHVNDRSVFKMPVDIDCRSFEFAMFALTCETRDNLPEIFNPVRHMLQLMQLGLGCLGIQHSPHLEMFVNERSQHVQSGYDTGINAKMPHDGVQELVAFHMIWQIMRYLWVMIEEERHNGYDGYHGARK